MAEESSNAFAAVSVKRRERSGRTPWRRIYSCIEPSSLLYANAQEQGWDVRFNNFRRYEVTGSFGEDKSDLNNNKHSARMNSTRHITLTGEWSDLKTLKNRDVSVNFSYPGKVLDLDSILDPRLSIGEQAPFSPSKKRTSYDLKAARRRRHTVSRIEYTSPFLPISEASEEKVNEAIDTADDVRKTGDRYRPLSSAECPEVDRSDTSSAERYSGDSSCRQPKTIPGKGISEDGLSASSSGEDEDLGFYGRYSRTDFLKSQAKDRYRTVDDLTKLGQGGLEGQVSRMENGEQSNGDVNGTSVESLQTTHSNGDDCSTKDRQIGSHSEGHIEEVAPGDEKTLTKSGNRGLQSVESDIRVILSEMISKIEVNFDHAPCASLEEMPEMNDVDSGSRVWTVDKFSRRVSEPAILSPIPQMRSKRRGKAKCSSPSRTDEGATRDKDILRRLYQLAISSICKISTTQPVISDLLVFLQSKGIWLSDPRLKKTLQLIQEQPQKAQTELLEGVFTRICSPSIDLIRNVLLSQMTVPGFSLFASKMEKVFHALQSSIAMMESNGGVRDDSSVDPTSNYIDFMLSRRSAKDKSVSLSICTVDGQRLRFGDTENFHALGACAYVLNYCIACRQNGIEIMKSHVGKTPLTDYQDEYTFDESGKVLNPFTKAGAITTSALLAQNETVENRISELHEVYSRTIAGEAICCDNLSYNLKRLYAHEEISLAYYLSARHKLPKMYNTTPGDILELNFQSTSTATTSDACSVAAATLAAEGICPTTGESVFKADVVHHVLKKMRDSRSQFHGKPNDSMCFVWDESGSIFLVVPGVLGLACFVQSQPRRAVREIVSCLVQNLDATFSFSMYRNLKRNGDNCRVLRK